MPLSYNYIGLGLVSVVKTCLGSALNAIVYLNLRCMDEAFGLRNTGKLADKHIPPRCMELRSALHIIVYYLHCITSVRLYAEQCTHSWM